MCIRDRVSTQSTWGNLLIIRFTSNSKYMSNNTDKFSWIKLSDDAEWGVYYRGPGSYYPAGVDFDIKYKNGGLAKCLTDFKRENVLTHDYNFRKWVHIGASVGYSALWLLATGNLRYTTRAGFLFYAGTSFIAVPECLTFLHKQTLVTSIPHMHLAICIITQRSYVGSPWNRFAARIQSDIYVFSSRPPMKTS
eukprot:TRINITY_DN5251_c0_g1_i1.p1 TRINITY_DN5251_c0_g1~~TRINITY_DN5251_c0_g1_i1.p1  ORF type:complete len:193 (-),score=0.71 TRINITY_DN5251_c0_g1_i1:229-807(-)